MIYTKKANFPYPVLMNFSDDYLDPEFELDVMIKDNTDDFLIEVTWEISSAYIKDLLKQGKANLYLMEVRINHMTFLRSKLIKISIVMWKFAWALKLFWWSIKTNSINLQKCRITRN